MTTYSIGGAAFTADAIAGKPFQTYGSLCGVDYAPYAGLLRGHALRAYNIDRPEIDYTIMSYATPIAWRTRDGAWTRVVDSFSVTTAKHQGALYRIPFTHDAGYRHSWLTDTQRSLVNRIFATPSKTIIPRGQEKRTVAVLVGRGALVQVVDGADGLYTLSDTVIERWQ